MNKYWQIPESKNQIIIKNWNIFYGQSELEINDSNEIPKYFDIISLDKIEKVENTEKTNYLKLFFNQYSTTKLYLSNERIKSEIVSHIKEYKTEYKYKKDLPTSIEFAKGHYILIVLFSLFFFCSLYFAIGISNGENFPLKNMRVGLLHYCLYVAKIGILNLIIVYTLDYLIK
ncbi:hypothetical protein, partial [Polaribacter atrinae]